MSSHFVAPQVCSSLAGPHAGHAQKPDIRSRISVAARTNSCVWVRGVDGGGGSSVEVASWATSDGAMKSVGASVLYFNCFDFRAPCGR